MDRIHFLNGKLVNNDQLVISPLDLGFSRGYAVFEFMITTNGYPFMMDRHLNRLLDSCYAMSLKLPWSKEQITNWILHTIDANKLDGEDIVLRIIISGGVSGTLTKPDTPNIAIITENRILCPKEDYKNGVRILLNEHERYEPLAKTTNYIQAVRVMNDAPSNVDEIIYYSDNMVREGTRSNVFAVINNELLTPKSKVLEGITRNVILNDLKITIPVKDQDFTVKDLLNASEVFITATGKEVMPVTKINDTSIGDGKVGAITKEVMSKYKILFTAYNSE